jgi:hypothetical protein
VSTLSRSAANFCIEHLQTNNNKESGGDNESEDTSKNNKNGDNEEHKYQNKYCRLFKNNNGNVRFFYPFLVFVVVGGKF